MKELIQDMIETLEAQAHCEKELAETNAKKDEKTNENKKLSTKLDSMTS